MLIPLARTPVLMRAAVAGTTIPVDIDEVGSRSVSELEGTRVMVTGATSGLGAAMAAALSAAGARVVATSRRLARAQAAAQQLGPDALGVELDVRDEARAAGVHDQRIVATEFER